MLQRNTRNKLNCLCCKPKNRTKNESAFKNSFRTSIPITHNIVMCQKSSLAVNSSKKSNEQNTCYAMHKMQEQATVQLLWLAAGVHSNHCKHRRQHHSAHSYSELMMNQTESATVRLMMSLTLQPQCCKVQHTNKTGEREYNSVHSSLFY